MPLLITLKIVGWKGERFLAKCLYPGNPTGSVLFRSVKKAKKAKKQHTKSEGIKSTPFRKSALAGLCPGRTKRERGLRTVIKSFALRFPPDLPSLRDRVSAP